MAELGFAELGLGHGWSGSPGHALNRWASISFFSPLHSDQPPFMFTGMFLRGPLFLPGSWRESGPCLGGTDTHAAPFRASHAGLLPEPCSALPLASHRLASSPSHCFLPALIATDPAVLWGGWFPGLWPSAPWQEAIGKGGDYGKESTCLPAGGSTTQLWPWAAYGNVALACQISKRI